ncbi:MAG: RsmB/NOP family class I SAM-dependent RNA methyltransferase, partial [Bacillales bacterium]|nr:RsmB/NOP family class I SAM-dependent RNA methyltransferase [Bacillales bacterium]
MDYKTHLKSIRKEGEQIVNSLNDLPTFTLRKSKKIKTETLLNLFPNLKPTNIIDDTYFYLEKDELGKSVFHLAGYYYIQDLSAQMVVHNLNIQENDYVLDMCASPGGKTIQANNYASLIIANEINRTRAITLKQNIERIGVKNVIVLNNNINDLLNKFTSFFDKVILDAPCSGEAMIRKSPEMRDDWSLEKIKRLNIIQKELIIQAYQMVKDGGYISYSTCSFELTENEDIVQHLLDNTACELINQKTYFPFEFSGEGQFIALIKVNKNNNFCPLKRKKVKRITETKIIFDWFLKYVNEPLNSLEYLDGYYYTGSNFNYELDNLNVLSNGIEIGKIEKGIFFPSFA